MDSLNCLSDRHINLLRSCADWLATRSIIPYFDKYKGLMQNYAADLRSIALLLEPYAQKEPVTLDELFDSVAADHAEDVRKAIELTAFGQYPNHATNERKDDGNSQVPPQN